MLCKELFFFFYREHIKQFGCISFTPFGSELEDKDSFSFERILDLSSYNRLVALLKASHTENAFLYSNPIWQERNATVVIVCGKIIFVTPFGLVLIFPSNGGENT